MTRKPEGYLRCFVSDWTAGSLAHKFREHNARSGKWTSTCSEQTIKKKKRTNFFRTNFSGQVLCLPPSPSGKFLWIFASNERECPKYSPNIRRILGEGKRGVQSTGVSPNVTKTRRDESQGAPSPEKNLQNKGFRAPIFWGTSLKLFAALGGHTRIFLHTHFPVTTKENIPNIPQNIREYLAQKYLFVLVFGSETRPVSTSPPFRTKMFNLVEQGDQIILPPLRKSKIELKFQTSSA